MANVPMTELGVLVGDHNLYTVDNDQKFIRVKEKMVHPDYNTPTPLNNDIGTIPYLYIVQGLSRRLNIFFKI